MTKWGDEPHWQMDATYLGSDEAGDWIGFPRGTHMSRPGVSVTTTNDQVGLVPAAGTSPTWSFFVVNDTPGRDMWVPVGKPIQSPWASAPR